MDLPYEVLVYIFKHLSHEDLLASSEVCRLWNEAASDFTFRSKQQIRFIRSVSRNDRCVANTYNDAQFSSKYTKFSFKDLDIENDLREFWKCNGEYIKELSFENCDMNEKIFVYILQLCNNLESLSIVNCRELFMSASFSDEVFKNVCQRTLKFIKKINISSNKYLTDALFSHIIFPSENLNALDLSDCQITFHAGLHKRFYPPNVDREKKPSASILSFPHIYDYIKKTASTLKILDFNASLIDGQALKSLCEIPELKLNELRMNYCDQINKIGIQSLCDFQTQMSVLELSGCSRLDNQLLSNICTKMINLRTLSIHRCPNVTDVGVINLSKLLNLKSLDIGFCGNVRSSGIQQGLCKSSNKDLNRLIIAGLDLNISTITSVAESFLKLVSLDMSSCFVSVTDYSIQFVFQYLLMLKILKIENCTAVSDTGLTGMGIGGNSDLFDDASPSVVLDDNFVRISLGSRAEEEIVKDAKRKMYVRDLCEKLNSNSEKRYNLACLKYLEELNISGCSKITDVSLMYAFNHRNLKLLDMSNCHQISHKGLCDLVKKCPSIHTLHLNNCFNINDEGIKLLATNLRRLKYLDISGCYLLTSESLQYIQANCVKLKELHIHNCPKMSLNNINSLYCMPVLQALQMNKTL